MLTNTLFAGLSGMDVAQAKLNVVGNNIANANTVAFKSSRVTLKSQFYVTDSGGSQPTSESGGSNPSQRGLGAVVSGVERNFTAGAIEATGKPTDLAIDGNGFFVVQGDERKYTRDGNFKLNLANQLVTNAGDFVQGYGVDARFNINAGQLTKLIIPLGTATTAQSTARTAFEGNLNAAGAVASGASILNSQSLTTLAATAPTGATLLTNLASTSAPATPLFTAGQTFTLAGQKGGRDLPEADFTVAATSTLNDLMGFYRQALGINTAVPDDGNAATPAPGVSLVADPANANAAMFTVVGNLGSANAVGLPAGSFTNSAGVSPFTFQAGVDAVGNASNPLGESIRASFLVYDSLGTPINVAVSAVLESTATTGNTWRFFAESPASANGDPVVGSGTLTFDSAGKLLASSGASLAIDRAGTGADSPLRIDLDFSQLTSLASNGSEMIMTEQDGAPIGSLESFSVGIDGIITGIFSNGATRSLGQLVMASFANQQGLLDRGGNMFVEGPNSGPAVIGAPGTLGTGKIVSSALELSNVDLSEEFINLIVASTGFTAASRVITTSDQLLNELLNAAR